MNDLTCRFNYFQQLMPATKAWPIYMLNACVKAYLHRRYFMLIKLDFHGPNLQELGAGPCWDSRMYTWNVKMTAFITHNHAGAGLING